jgi:hypothetical protein
MKCVLVGFLEVTAALAIFVALVAVYNWAAPWEPGSWAYLQRQIGATMQWISIGIGVILVTAMVVWKGIAALVARLRHLS